MINPMDRDDSCMPATCEDEARAAKILQKKRERLKREKEMTDAALRLYSTRKLTKIVEEEEETPPVEICSMKKKSWECTNQLDKTVDYRLAGMNSVQRLIFKYFGPGPDLAVDSPTSPSSGSSHPRYPHTEQSRLNRRQQILRQKQKKSDEVRDTLINKIEELTRLKKRLAEGSGRYRCHLAERKADLAERKRKFAEELALKYNLPVEALHKHADKIYENYRQNLAQEKKLEREKLEHQLEVYNKILAERKKTIPLNISRKRPKPKQDTLTEEVTDILDEDVQEVEEGSTKKEEGDKETGEGKKTVARKKITLKTKKDKGKENRVGKSEKKSGKEEETKGTAKKKTGSSQQVEKQPPRQPAAPELESKENLFFPEILDGIGELEALEREKLEFQKSIQPLPLEKGLVSVPASVVIKDYKPDQSYKCKIRLKNITRHAIFCRFSNINYVKGDSYFSLEMEARDRERLAPGLVAEFSLSFHPIDETQETEAIVQFVTDTSNGERRLFQVPVHCSPPAARPTILTQSIVFPKVNVWTDKVHKKFLKIANSGVEPCTASIKKRVVETPQFDMAKGEGDNEDAGRMEKDGGDETEITKTENMVDDVGPHEADNMVISLIEELVDNVFQVFRFDQLYAIAVEANSEVKIPVAFVATMMPCAGYALDQYDVLFHGKFVAIDKQTFSIEGEIEPLPIELWPPVIDMKQCLIGGDVQQSTLSIINRSHIPYPVSIKFPHSLACHVDVDPSDVFAHPNSSITVVVRIMLRWSFLNEASKYFDPETKVLDFPLFVDVYSRQHEGARRLEASVLAVVTAAQDLTITPDVVDLGPVTTMETCQATIFITNNSLAAHQFAFLDTPKWVTIMPNYGMGAIEPGERVRLHLLYSPGAEQVEQPGDDQRHDFTIRCTTMTAVANHPQLPIKAHRHSDMSQVCTSPDARGKRGSDVSPFDSASKGDTMSMVSTVDNDDMGPQLHDGADELMRESEAFEKLLTIGLPTLDQIALKSGHEVGSASHDERSDQLETSSYLMSADSTAIDEESPLDLPKLYIKVKCRAHVIDTMCELSAQKVFLPPTPCYSHSIVSLYLRCPNRSSNPGCYCGKIQGVENNPYKQCISRFQFFVDRRELDVQPRTGDISIGQDVKVYLVLRPVLRTGEVMKTAAEIKRYEAREKLIEDWRLKSFKKLADKICTEGETKQLTRTKSANTKGKNKENKNDVTTGATDDVTQSCFSEPVKEPEMKINPAKLKINAKDIFTAKKNLLETMETHGFETTVKCLIETQFLKTGKVRRETLKCRVLCPIVRPDIIVETPDEEPVLKFGRTAIGSKKIITVKVHNVSRTRIRVKHSLLNPIGPFTCPLSIPLSQGLNKVTQGILLEPENWLEIPIVFSPHQSGMMDEFFEVSTVKTIFSLNAKGEGIVPKYKIIPEFRVQYLEADEEKTTECVIVVHNECNAPLTFCMWKLYTRVGTEPEEPLVESEVEKSRTENDQRSKKEKPKDKKTQSGTNGEKGKTKKGNYDTALKPHMMEALEKTFAKGEDVMESVFVESGAVTLLPKRKGQLSIKFTPCRVEEKQTTGNPTNGTPADIQLKSVSKGRNKSKGHSRKKDGKNAKEENKSEPEAKRVYVCKYSVTVGVLPVTEWLFWGRVNTPPAKMKKKTKKKK